MAPWQCRPWWGSGSTHGSSLQFWHFPVYGENAYVLEGRRCMGMIMGLCLVFYVFFCKPVDVVEGIPLRACCSDGGACNVRVGGGWLCSENVGMFIIDYTGVGLYFENWTGDGDCQIALAMDWRTSPWMWWRWRFGCESCFLIWCSDVRLSVAIYMWVAVYDCSCYSC